MLPAPLLLVMRPEFFALDRELLGGVSRAATWQQLEEEIRDYTMDARNRSWWRRRGRCRLSTRRLRRIAAHYLPGGQSQRGADRAME